MLVRRNRILGALVWGVAVALAAVTPPVVVGVASATSYVDTLYAPASDTTVPESVRTAAPRYDPAKRTVAILIGNHGANGGDVLPPYETFTATGAFNVYTVSPDRRRVPLLGGLDLVPDFSLAELDERLAGRTPDIVVVPQMPPAGSSMTVPVEDWLRRQARGGALVLGVCAGAEVLASAGLLDGRNAASHWFKLRSLEKAYPDVKWQRATRYVDDGDIVTTGGVLAGIDGSLRVIERVLDSRAAAAAADAVGWRHYSPGRPAPLPRSTFGLPDTIAGVNLTFRPRPTLGVVLTNGVGEIELASVFAAYTEAAYAARTRALGAGSTAAVLSRHGMVFVPRGDAFATRGLDRLVVPGAATAQNQRAALDTMAARTWPSIVVEYPHAEPGFAFDPVLRGMARTIDVPTARWRAKTLEYPASDLSGLQGPGWPWVATLLPLLYALGGATALIAARRSVVAGLRRRRARRSRRDGPAARVDTLDARAPEPAGL
ncbi:DJ-1/PfpI family protein [Virgisporangium aurantiacum]|uniref:DJ-1/PfpI domain-containing protein n=1 Tax=Virgisporangium aurantiacum TaxID=175570 RepID=A0A8J3Z4P2_9ACTN|nr:DJ-1/PfpI family protein [Virgisporangium aurantiacum]GIJ56747.1 hypothetical protein Vau01_042630 [Virgisporangium aurantiacum]